MRNTSLSIVIIWSMFIYRLTLASTVIHTGDMMHLHNIYSIMNTSFTAEECTVNWIRYKDERPSSTIMIKDRDVLSQDIHAPYIYVDISEDDGGKTLTYLCTCGEYSYTDNVIVVPHDNIFTSRSPYNISVYTKSKSKTKYMYIFETPLSLREDREMMVHDVYHKIDIPGLRLEDVFDMLAVDDYTMHSTLEVLDVCSPIRVGVVYHNMTVSWFEGKHREEEGRWSYNKIEGRDVNLFEAGGFELFRCYKNARAGVTVHYYCIYQSQEKKEVHIVDTMNPHITRKMFGVTKVLDVKAMYDSYVCFVALCEDGHVNLMCLDSAIQSTPPVSLAGSSRLEGRSLGSVFVKTRIVKAHFKDKDCYMNIADSFDQESGEFNYYTFGLFICGSRGEKIYATYAMIDEENANIDRTVPFDPSVSVLCMTNSYMLFNNGSSTFLSHSNKMTRYPLIGSVLHKYCGTSSLHIVSYDKDRRRLLSHSTFDVHTRRISTQTIEDTTIEGNEKGGIHNNIIHTNGTGYIFVHPYEHMLVLFPGRSSSHVRHVSMRSILEGLHNTELEVDVNTRYSLHELTKINTVDKLCQVSNPGGEKGQFRGKFGIMVSDGNKQEVDAGMFKVERQRAGYGRVFNVEVDDTLHVVYNDKYVHISDYVYISNTTAYKAFSDTARGRMYVVQFDKRVGVMIVYTYTEDGGTGKVSTMMINDYVEVVDLYVHPDGLCLYDGLDVGKCYSDTYIDVDNEMVSENLMVSCFYHDEDGEGEGETQVVKMKLVASDPEYNSNMYVYIIVASVALSLLYIFILVK